jgi:hypothetical protein
MFASPAPAQCGRGGTVHRKVCERAIREFAHSGATPHRFSAIFFAFDRATNRGIASARA